MIIKDFIQKIFNKKKQPENNSRVNQIVFSLDQSHQSFVKIRVENLETIAADSLGHLLFLINSGGMNKSVLEVLTDLGSQDVSANQFIQKTLEFWKHYEENNLSTNYTFDEPVIRPSHFNQNAKQ
jgi:hypothetical protein